MSDQDSPAQVARRIGVTPSTLRRWIATGLVPAPQAGEMTTAGIAHARMVARLRERGHSLRDIREATESGRLAHSSIEELLPAAQGDMTLEQASEATGLEPALIERVLRAAGLQPDAAGRLAGDDVELLRAMAAILAAGFPLVALLQIVRVYGHALSQIADAEVRLFHLYVHEPLMRDGVPGWEIAEEMEGVARGILPLAAPAMEHLHRRFLRHFIEQDVIGHMESDLEGGELDLGRVRVAVAFADLAGYTRLTEEAGDEEALGAVERFVDAVEETLPDEARILKTIGDEVMIVGADPATLVDWAVGFSARSVPRPLPRIGIHYGEALYRDGDYYGREVNLAARVAAHAAGGEVLVTRPVREHAAPGLRFRRIGEVHLKGITRATELYAATASRRR